MVSSKATARLVAEDLKPAMKDDNDLWLQGRTRRHDG